ncbi:MAG: type II toxin-antitoxin system VapC family toxin [Sciscionella sp.]|nr:type II toxin-antitoxin system VapC family toxin [Sciscionella sp.]
MVILDTSAIISVLKKEIGYEKVRHQLALAASVRIGAPTLVETTMVAISRIGVHGKLLLRQFVSEQGVAVIEFTESHADRARQAFERFGKGRHPAGLNMGDCFSYATASIAREPLLCVGNDFAQTDLELVPLGE